MDGLWHRERGSHTKERPRRAYLIVKERCEHIAYWCGDVKRGLNEKGKMKSERRGRQDAAEYRGHGLEARATEDDPYVVSAIKEGTGGNRPCLVG
jgi:hypothetical protein